MASIAPEAAGRLSFWQKMAIGLALFITFGFLQFALRGFVNIPSMPAYVHLHAAAMMGWLAITVIQPTLAERADTTLHRRVGWTGVGLATAVVVIGIYTARHIIAAGMQPPFFTQPYFLALTHIGLAAFAAMVIAAVLARKDTGWHRRLMLGSTVLLMEPALGRILPMPLIMPWGEWLVMAIQLMAVAIIVRHDHRERGSVHPATLCVMGVVIITHVLVETAARMAATQTLVDAILHA